jgi:hypothetical protein
MNENESVTSSDGSGAEWTIQADICAFGSLIDIVKKWIR